MNDQRHASESVWPRLHPWLRRRGKLNHTELVTKFFSDVAFAADCTFAELASDDELALRRWMELSRQIRELLEEAPEALCPCQALLRGPLEATPEWTRPWLRELTHDLAMKRGEGQKAASRALSALDLADDCFVLVAMGMQEGRLESARESVGAFDAAIRELSQRISDLPTRLVP